MVNKPLIRPYFWGGSFGGGRLTSHEKFKGRYTPGRLPSLKRTAKNAPEKWAGWNTFSFPFGARPVFRGCNGWLEPENTPSGSIS